MHLAQTIDSKNQAYLKKNVEKLQISTFVCNNVYNNILILQLPTVATSDANADWKCQSLIFF